MPNHPTTPTNQNRSGGSSSSNQPGAGFGGGGSYPPPPTSTANSSSTQDVAMGPTPTQNHWIVDSWTRTLVHNTDCGTCDAYRQHIMRHANRNEPSLEQARRERDNYFTTMGSADILRDLAERNREVTELEREVARLRRERDDARWRREEAERRLEDRERAPPPPLPANSRRRSPRREYPRDERRSASPRRLSGRERMPPPLRDPEPSRHLGTVQVPTNPAPQQLPQQPRNEAVPPTTTTTTTIPHPIQGALAGDSEESEEDSEEERKKKRRKLPKPPKLPNPASRRRPQQPGMNQQLVVPTEQRANMRAPPIGQLVALGRPASSSGPFTFEGIQSIGDAQNLLAAAEREGNWTALHLAQRVVAVVSAMNHDQQSAPPGANYLVQHWRRPRWLQDAQSLRETYECDDSADFAFGALPPVAQRQPSDPMREQAPWVALHSNPWTHTGVHVATGFQVDLATLLGNNLFRLLHPRGNRSARLRFMYMFVELASQPFLYEQLLQHWNVPVAPREDIQPLSALEVMAREGRFSMEAMVRNLARRGITVELMNSVNDWGIQFLADAIVVFPEEQAFWRQLQGSASNRLRVFGRPPVQDLGIDRDWTLPEEWNLAERRESMARERLHRISLNGQTTRGTRSFNQRAGETRQLARTERFAIQYVPPAASSSTTSHEPASTSSMSTRPTDASVPTQPPRELLSTSSTLTQPLAPSSTTTEPTPQAAVTPALDTEMAEPTGETASLVTQTVDPSTAMDTDDHAEHAGQIEG
ncbi:hypothetical protein K435DRAFT_868709 [Dendrothele bispora CBS 962.96]|uniref:Uncharacterized protein n=1 Tax=Dendrothele bispora (strain CBS 962.96) TaxID=1314807 RepID=A0A4S8LBJ2_DENBC|nr:hypothetical protein K435DRAFT_868709 [Dendrothele bispora CBS 962.96]